MKSPALFALTLLAAFGTASLTSGCAHESSTNAVETKRTSPQTEKNTANTSVSFDARSAKLSTAARDDLMRVVRDIRGRLQDGDRIDRITVAAWSDRNLPPADRKLTAHDRALAEARAEAIAVFLKDELAVPGNLDTYNMAETSNWLARSFNMRDGSLRSTATKQASAPAAHPEFEVISAKGGPSEAVVVIEAYHTVY